MDAHTPTTFEIPAAHFTAALLKVASRCNLNCDYCYVYKHGDQSWRNQPHFMDASVVTRFAHRLRDYIEELHLSDFSIIFHGGEPLLYGANNIVRAVQAIRSIAPSTCALDFSLQTNGVLLSDLCLAQLEAENITISLSLDGPRRVHDLHRLNHAGDSSYDATMDALARLASRKSDGFRGVIAVIDPTVPPVELLEFFHPLDLPRLDLLLPDATYASPPFGRSENPTLYQKWLEEAFEVWFSKFPNLPIRWFDAILASRLGVPSPTDIMGFGEVNLIVIEADGSYTDHDVFKIVQPNRALLHSNVFTTSLTEIAQHRQLKEHGYRLSLPGLATECKTCPVVEACGGGCVMHRYHPTRGLDAPSVYCGEMFAVLRLATKLLREAINGSSEISSTEPQLVLSFGKDLIEECQRWRKATERRADVVVADQGGNRLGVSAAAVLLRNSAKNPDRVDHRANPASTKWLDTISIQPPEPWLTLPFLDTIRVPSIKSEEVQHGIELLEVVREYLSSLDPLLPKAIAALISDIIFVETTAADEDGIFSFSDDTAPNVLYIAAYAGGKPLGPDDLADSIFHEFLHQVLYHMEREGKMLLDYAYPRFPAPWRAGLRPAGGFLHGSFVFSGLAHYWAALANANLPSINKTKAKVNSEKCREQAMYGLLSLQDFALLTPRGRMFVSALLAGLNAPPQSVVAPGLAVRTLANI